MQWSKSYKIFHKKKWFDDKKIKWNFGRKNIDNFIWQGGGFGGGGFGGGAANAAAGSQTFNSGKNKTNSKFGKFKI